MDGNGYCFEKMFRKYSVVPDVSEAQVVPLSDDLMMVPESPTAIKLSFAYAIPMRSFVVPELLGVHVAPLSDEVRIVPSLPVTTKVLLRFYKPYIGLLNCLQVLH